MEGDDSRRVFVRQRTQDDGIHDAENGGVRADAESQREGRDGGEAGIFAEHTKGESQVVEECFKKRKTAAVAVDFFRLLDAPQFYKRFPSRFCGVHAGTQIVFDVHLEMAVHLYRKIPILPHLAEQSAESQQPCSDYSHNHASRHWPV